MRCILLFLLLGLFAQAGVSQVSARLKNKVSNSSSAIRNNKNKTTAERKQSLAGNDRPKQIENATVDQGFDALEAGDYNSAIAAFKNYDASDADAAFGLGLAYYETDRFGEAIEPLERAFQLEPEQTDALYVLGLVHRESGDYEAAASAFAQLIEIDNQDADAWYELGSLLNDEGFTEDAAYCLQQARESDPSSTFDDY